jgi:hypothetical protein
MARFDRKERLDTNERDRERKKRTVAEGDKHEKSEKNKRENERRKETEKIPLQMRSILAHCRSRQTTIATTRVQNAVCTRVLMREDYF